VSFVQAYGMTELSAVATVLHARHLVGAERECGRHRSAGRATFGVEIDIVAPDGKSVARGDVGEIIVRSPGRMIGYWERPEETKAVVIDGWMHTGDGGYMDEHGFVYVVDRIKDMIVSGGENVYSAEVENVIAMHEGVSQVAVIGIPSEMWGEQVHAIVVPRPAVIITSEDIIDFCKSRIAGYKCPRSVAIRSEALPLSGAGKILKIELRKPFWGAPPRQVS
jgi:long-chain acyl-CoA synthetase